MSHKLQTNARILSLSVRMLIQNLDTFIWSDIKFSFYPYFIYSAPDKSLRNFKVISLVENLIQLKFDTYPPEIYFEHGKCLSKGSFRKLCMFLFTIITQVLDCCKTGHCSMKNDARPLKITFSFERLDI